MKRLYFDTETTGFPQKPNTPDEACPHIVQLAAILVDDAEGEVASMNVIVRPEGWTVPKEAADVHGITTEKAEAFGIPIKVALATFSNLVRVSEQVVAHNFEFDRKLVAYEVDRLGRIHRIEEKPQFCTMLATVDLCKLPGRYGKFKWPKLMEAHEILLGEGFDGAHDALADVRACQRLHAYLLARQ